MCSHTLYNLNDPNLSDPHHPETFDESFITLSGSDHETIKTVMQNNQVGLGVFELKVFSLSWCERFLVELDQFQKWANEGQLHLNRPNSMNNYGVIIQEMGLGNFFDDVVIKLRPITSVLFPHHFGDTLDSQHTFTVEYQQNGDRNLGFHVDDSHVTLNLCLGYQFEGANVYFKGERCPAHVNTAAKSQELYEHCNKAGLAILHAGKNRHGARRIESGRRVNLVIWCRSTQGKALETSPGACACQTNSSELQTHHIYSYCAVCNASLGNG